VPAPADEYGRAYAELIDAYNANASAQHLLAQTTVRLALATERFEAAREAALANGEITE